MVFVFMLDLFFPKRCLGCGQEGKYFCPQCQEGIKPLIFQIFPVISFFPYKGLIKKAIIKLKYGFVTDLGEELAELMLKVIIQNQEFSWLKKIGQKRKVILIPLPLHQQRWRWRGFNQSELLGKKLAESLNWILETQLLARQKNTQPQVSLKSEERRENIKDSFIITRKMTAFLKRKTIILFDDVWTTGSTLKEAQEVLRKVGFKKVFGLTICR
jgi:competence protein ComFC